MPRSYRVYTKRKLTEDPELAKGYVRKSRKQNETDEDPYLSVKYILKSELELLDTVLDKTRPDKDVEFEDEVIWWSKGQYVNFIKNQYHLSGRPRPYNATITVSLEKYSMDEIIRQVAECFLLPISIRIDVWATLSSKTRERDLLYPSCGTCFNKKQKILNDDDIDQLCAEVSELSHEKIIQKHFIHASNSELRIVKLHACEIYISKFDFASVRK